MKSQELRRLLYEGNYSNTECANCKGIQRFKEYPHLSLTHGYLFNDNNEYVKNANININEFINGVPILNSLPLEIVYVPGVLCNIKCIHCFQPEKSEVKPESIINFYNQLGNKSIVNLVSGGDPFVMPQIKLLYATMTDLHRLSSEFFIQTNGLKIMSDFEKYKGFKSYHIKISINAYEKSVYERIHRGGNFEKIVKSMCYINEQRKFKRIKLSLVMVLMRSNFYELKFLFDFAKKNDFDDVWITPVHGAYGRNDPLENENIFENPSLLNNIPDWLEILKQSIAESMISGYKNAFYNLLYIKKILSGHKN